MARAFGIVLGVAVDEVLADPRRGHPVALFGTAAAKTERLTYRDSVLPGAAHTLVLLGGAAGIGLLTERLGKRHPLLRVLGTAAATWATVGGSTLAAEGTAMGRSLDAGEIEAARARLPHLCGRDPELLDGTELARATVESVAENTSDAVVAPLFWGAVAGIPGLLAYRAVNTLDAMIGHRSERYRRFGMVAARADDVANLIPARLAAALTAFCAPVVGGSSASALRAWRLDAGAHPSPNAGQVEAAFAGALQIRLGGRTVYRHGVEDRPVLGDGRNPDAGHVTRAVELSRVTGWAAAALCGLLGLAVGRRAH
ncbi:cobalamin biosynthesis protein [Sciscionella marina]|uniref:cobalamin biosynthesis protein n=1 Tax=Sciscionella marina TaxID=508770 RepID=UPI0003758589